MCMEFLFVIYSCEYPVDKHVEDLCVKSRKLCFASTSYFITLGVFVPFLPHFTLFLLHYSLSFSQMDGIFTFIHLEAVITTVMLTRENKLIVIGCEWSGRGGSYVTEASHGKVVISQLPVRFFHSLLESYLLLDPIKAVLHVHLFSCPNNQW